MKNIRLFSIIATLLLTFAPVAAQMNVGGWKIHPIFGKDVQNIIDTGKMLYYLVNGNLYCYYKDSDENEFISKQTKLNNVVIKQIYYNYENKYLAIAYEDSTIDILYDDGSVVNIPDISQANIDRKGINDVTFKGNRVYVATEFGYAILNSDKGFEIMESQKYGESIASMAEVADYLVISKDDGSFYSPKSLQYHTLSSFKLFRQKGNGKITVIDDKTLLLDEGWVYKYTFSEAGASNPIVVTKDTFKKISRISTGFIATGKYKPRYMYMLNADCVVTSATPLPDDMQESLLASTESDGSLWELSPKGVRHIMMENGEVSTIMTDYFRYNASTVSYPYFLRYNNALNKLFVMDCGPYLNRNDYNLRSSINTLENGFWTDVTPAEVPTTGAYAENVLKDLFSPVFDPDDPSTLYVGTWFEGAYKLKDGESVIKYDWTNSPFNVNWVCCISDIAFDKNKNLWMLQCINDPKIHVLPRSKSLLAEVTPADWISPDVNVLNPNFKSQMLITKKDDIKMLTTGGAAEILIIIDDGGNPASSSIKNTVIESGKIYDQDGKPYTWGNIECMLEDANGKVWIGTTNGVIEMSPANAFNANFSVNRIKVPRNDGTNYADYLLTGTTVTALAIDGANRKWIGTLDMGLYLVSADGSNVIKHFNTSNSMLTSNHILSICCDPNNNTVYIGTPNGLVEYYSDAAPASEDYSNIYAYPNPVRPDYTGEIIISGLMDNSLVKIADAGGNVIRSIRSTSGMATWDGCYSNGERVRTGVYYVLASQNENGKSSGVVTKILFIK